MEKIRTQRTDLFVVPIFNTSPEYFNNHGIIYNAEGKALTDPRENYKACVILGLLSGLSDEIMKPFVKSTIKQKGSEFIDLYKDYSSKEEFFFTTVKQSFESLVKSNTQIENIPVNQKPNDLLILTGPTVFQVGDEVMCYTIHRDIEPVRQVVRVTKTQAILDDQKRLPINGVTGCKEVTNYSNRHSVHMYTYFSQGNQYMELYENILAKKQAEFEKFQPVCLKK